MTRSIVSPLVFSFEQVDVPIKSTKISVECDAGFGNVLYLRGSTGGLNWEHGISMHNEESNLWTFEFHGEFSPGECKVLRNDFEWEAGPNHPLSWGEDIRFSPRF